MWFIYMKINQARKRLFSKSRDRVALTGNASLAGDQCE